MRGIGYKLKKSCPGCGSDMILRKGRFGLFYGCSTYPECEEMHGAHQANGKPLGIPADKETREARVKAHKAFDAFWKEKHWTRNEAYKWLWHVLEIEASEGHIGMLTKSQCAVVIREAKKVLKKLREKKETS